MRSTTCSRTSPTGVPPLELTGERTLPDVPEENYWFRRHLAVYEWIAERVGGAAGRRPRLRRGLRLRRARRDGRRGGRRRRQPRGPRARPAALPARRTCASSAAWSRTFDEPVRRDRLPADDRAHPRARRRCSTASPRAAPVSLRLDPEPADARARGRREVRQPLAPARVHGGRVPRAARAALLRGRDPRPLPRPQAARCTSSRSASAGTASTGAAAHEALLRPLRAGDLRLRLRARADGRVRPRPRARLPRGLPGE